MRTSVTRNSRSKCYEENQEKVVGGDDSGDATRTYIHLHTQVRMCACDLYIRGNRYSQVLKVVESREGMLPNRADFIVIQ